MTKLLERWGWIFAPTKVEITDNSTSLIVARVVTRLGISTGSYQGGQQWRREIYWGAARKARELGVPLVIAKPRGRRPRFS